MTDKPPASSPDAVRSAWTVLESKYTFEDPWIRLRSDVVRLPNNKILSPYHTIEYPDWVNVIALTAEKNIILVEQYRHPVRQTFIEFPAGAVENGEELPLAAMKRELLEETGHVSEDWHPIGTTWANASRQTNRVHSFLALDARRVADQMLDEGEIIRVHELAFAEFLERAKSGAHPLPGLQLTCLFWLQTYVERSTDTRIRRLLPA